MKKFFYVVAAVLAVAPLAAIAPASAAVQHSAAAQTVCDGNTEVTFSNYNAAGLLIGYWHLNSSGVVLDSYSKTPADFCEIVIGSGEYNLREEGTSDCAAFIPSENLVETRGCDYSSANQIWFVPPEGYGYISAESSSQNETLQGLGGDTEVLMNSYGLSGEEWNVNTVS